MSSPSTTNHALGLPELLHSILEFVATGSSESRHSRIPDAEARRSLSVLARTCRAFSEPSLDFLWGRLVSLKPLIQCFSGVVDEKRVKVNRSLLALVHMIMSHTTNYRSHRPSPNARRSGGTHIVSENSKFPISSLCGFCRARASGRYRYPT